MQILSAETGRRALLLRPVLPPCYNYLELQSAHTWLPVLHA